MNLAEHHMRGASRTADRMTRDAGWAGWHYRRPSILRRLLMLLIGRPGPTY